MSNLSTTRRPLSAVYYLLFILILLLAAGLRFHKLDAQSFWNDEGNSARLSERSISLIIEGTASDIHPPLYYLMLRGWRELVGETEFGLRSLSAFLGIGVVALTMNLAHQTFVFLNHQNLQKLKGKKQKSHLLVLLVGLLTAVNPALIYYSQETRMYELLAFLGLLSTVLLVQWVKRGMVFRSRTAVAYILTLALGLYTHYFFPAVIVSHLVICVGLILRRLIGRNEKDFRSIVAGLICWVALVGTAVFLYLPWLPIFIRQAGGRPAVRAPLFEFLGEGGRFLVLGTTIEPETVTPALVPLLLLPAVGLLPLNRRLTPLQLVALTGFGVPMVAMWLAGTTTAVFYKFMLAAIPPLLLLAAYGFVRVTAFTEDSQHRALYFVAVSLVGLFLLGTYTSLQNMYSNPAYARADYRGIAERISAESAARKSAVILNAANQWEVFTYYYKEVDDVYPLPRGFPDPARIETELLALTERYARLYAIFWGEAERDPERLVERWLDANTFKAAEEWVGDVRFVTYAVPSEPPGEMETAVDLRFGESITLLGYTIEPNPVQPGDILQVALFWETAAPLDTRYKVFLHLIGPDGKRWSQRDSEPGGNLALTTTWLPGQALQDNHGLLVPLDAPPGDYTLLLGLYDISNPNARLAIETAEGMVDAFSILINVVRK